MTFRAGVDAVVVDVSVTARNRPVGGPARGFQRTDNGVPQRVTDVSGNPLPLDVTLVVDMSGRGVLQPSLVYGVNKIPKSLRAGDCVRIITFAGTVRERTPFTMPRRHRHSRCPTGSLDALKPNGQTAAMTRSPCRLSPSRQPVDEGRHRVQRGPGHGGSSGPRRFSMWPHDPERLSFLCGPRSTRSPWSSAGGRHSRADAREPLAIPPAFFRELAHVTGGRVEEVKAFTMLRNDSEGWHFQASFGAGAALGGIPSATAGCLSNELRASVCARGRAGRRLAICGRRPRQRRPLRSEGEAGIPPVMMMKSLPE